MARGEVERDGEEKGENSPAQRRKWQQCSLEYGVELGLASENC